MSEPSRFGRLLGICCGAAGAGLLLSWLTLWITKSTTLFPFYDSVVQLGSWKLFVVVAIYVLLLLATAWSLVNRRKFAPLLFAVAGWGALLNTTFMLWPRKRLLSMMEFGLNAAKKRGMVGEDASLLDLVRTQLTPTMFNTVAALLATVVVVWLALLILGSLHVWRARAEYSN